MSLEHQHGALATFPHVAYREGEPCRLQVLGRVYMHLETLSTCANPSPFGKDRPKGISKVWISWAFSVAS